MKLTNKKPLIPPQMLDSSVPSSPSSGSAPIIAPCSLFLHAGCRTLFENKRELAGFFKQKEKGAGQWTKNCELEGRKKIPFIILNVFCVFLFPLARSLDYINKKMATNLREGDKVHSSDLIISSSGGISSGIQVVHRQNSFEASRIRECPP